MPYKNFDLHGAELVAELAHGAPLRTNRLITALEEFVCGGAATLVAAGGIPGARVEVYLTPPRYVLRSYLMRQHLSSSMKELEP